MDFSKIGLMYYGPEMIHHESDPVEDADLSWLPKLKEAMVAMMRKSDGVGLAAPQLGVFKNYIVVELRNGNVIDLINPEVTRLYGKEIDGLEGCLSIPPFDNECQVPRMEHIDIECFGTDYRKKSWTFRRDDARIVQHELDHLTGTFFIDRVSEKRRLEVLQRFSIWKREWEKQGKPFPFGGESNARVARSFATYGR